MDLDMFAHPSTRQNLDRLRLFGNRIIEPAEGELASHLVGKGRMEEPDKIVAVLEDFFASQTRLEKKKIVITAGPTYEKIDPVRFIGNYSSGKMGFALAEACAEQGAEVTLIAGPVSLTVVHPNIKRIDVESAEEMYQAAITAFRRRMPVSFVPLWRIIARMSRQAKRSRGKRKEKCRSVWFRIRTSQLR